MENMFFQGLINSGPIGAVLAFMMYVNYKMIQKLFTVIETNTKALTINNEKLEELTDAEQNRRREFGGGAP